MRTKIQQNKERMVEKRHRQQRQYYKNIILYGQKKDAMIYLFAKYNKKFVI